MSPAAADAHFALSVGITGHRPNKLPQAAVPRISHQLGDVMRAIDDAARRRQAPVRLISGFAEGADQIAVAAAPPHWTVEAILPFPKSEYLKDFEQSASGDGRDVRDELRASLARASVVTELPTHPAHRNESYLAAGRAMLVQIDILIAVWDGEAAKPGGTGQIVREACDASIPVVWLSNTADREPVLVDRFQDGAPAISDRPWTSALNPPARPTRATPA